jgi:tRNA 2-thiouridine synthesizing protein E
MANVTINGKTYEIGLEGFLVKSDDWDENFAEGMAPKVGIERGLTQAHWDVIYFIRDTLQKQGACPLVYQTCKMNRLHLKELKNLFPTGYLRGACKLAGVTYRHGSLGYAQEFVDAGEIAESREKTYTVDARGFLVRPQDWDEQFAMFKAYEMKMPEKLGDGHWQVIHYLRNAHKLTGKVPTVYETCDANHIELEELERLFPDGYHRGAIKIAGLRVI